MESRNDSLEGDPRPAATVVMLRDGVAGLEVFLIRRHGLSDVLGGAYVFPGGKVDAQDARLDTAAHLDQPASALHVRLGEPALDVLQAAGLYVAALREAFEESGVLYGAGAGAAEAARATALLREGRTFGDV
ncbi:MAG: NUDIX hydrolase, partial [Ramlibacter sp.]